jgi:hypothetical protein
MLVTMLVASIVATAAITAGVATAGAAANAAAAAARSELQTIEADKAQRHTSSQRGVKHGCLVDTHFKRCV